MKATYDSPLEGLSEATQVIEGNWLRLNRESLGDDRTIAHKPIGQRLRARSTS